MKLKFASLLAGVVACGLVNSGLAAAAGAAETAKPAMSDEAAGAIQNMSKTLLSKEFSFKAQTIRVYLGDQGQPLHIFHTMNILVRRPDRAAADVNGDDGATKLRMDGKTASIFSVTKNQYATLPVPSDLGSALDEVSAKADTDFPLGDFLADDPGAAVLSDVVAGWQVGTAMVDGIECRHLFFIQKGGINLELWVDKTEQALLRRLIVTYLQLPGRPDFIAQFSDWNFNVHPSEADFVFQPPAGATKIDLKQAVGGAQGQGDGK